MGKIKQISVHSCVIPDYQRIVDERRVNRIVESWNPVLAGVVKVAHNPDGTFNVIDGQHRIAALRRLGEREVWAEVESNLDVAQQAETFVQLQTERAPVRPYDRHRAMLRADDPQAVLIESVLSDFGLKFTGSGSAAVGISSIRGIYRILEQYGEDALRKELRVITEAWPEVSDRDRFSKSIIEGINHFVPRYPEVSSGELAERLAMVNPVILQRDARVFALSGSAFGGAIARQILKVYNHKRSSRRLDDRMDTRVPTLAQERAYAELAARHQGSLGEDDDQ